MRLLARYGAAELEAAITEALARNVPHPNAVRLTLERRREERRQLPPVAVNLPQHVRAKDTPVRPHHLDSYSARDRKSEEKGSRIEGRKTYAEAKPETVELAK